LARRARLRPVPAFLVDDIAVGPDAEILVIGGFRPDIRVH